MPTKTKNKKTTKTPKILGPYGKTIGMAEPDISPEKMVMMIIGFPGCGKSSFMVEWQSFGFKPFFLPFQPGLEGYKVNAPMKDGMRYILTDYDDACRWIEWAALETDFNPIVFDPVAPMHDLCIDVEGGPAAVADRAGGAGWFLARGRFMDAIKPIAVAGKGVVFIAHLHMREVFVGKETKTIFQANLSGKVKQLIDQITDLELHFTIQTNEKTGEAEWIAVSKKDETGIGKDRLGYIPDGQFSRGKSAKEAAKNFLSLFYDLK